MVNKITDRKLRQIGSIDIFKFIMSLFVILLHVPPVLYDASLSVYPSWLQMIFAFAVPYFFISSGFLTARKMKSFDSDEEKDRYLRNRIIAVFKIFIIWTLIYIPLSMISLGDISVLEKIFITAKEIITRGHPHLSWPLWYLYSLLLTLIFVYLLRRCRIGILILLIFYLFTSFIVYLTEFSGNIWIQRIGFYFENPFGGGLPIIIGFITCDYPAYFKTYLSIIFLILLSICLFYLEMPYFQVAGGLGLFALSLRIKLSDRRKAMYNWARTVSMWNYYIHMYILVLVQSLFSLLDFSLGLVAGCLICMCTVVFASNILYYLGNLPYLSRIKLLLR